MIAAFRPIQIEGETAALGSVPFEIGWLLVREGLLEERQGELWLQQDGLSMRLEAIRRVLCKEGLIGPPRDELMPVCLLPGGPELGRIDRSAVRALGLWIDKVHINGIVQTSDGVQIWLARRAPDAEWNPDRFDTMVAGGRAAGRGLAETACSEGWEEAGLQGPQLKGLRAAGRLALTYASKKGFHREVLTMFDLALPADFVPQCQDGEIASFSRVTLEALAMLTETEDKMKFTSAMVCKALLRRLAGEAAGFDRLRSA